MLQKKYCRISPPQEALTKRVDRETEGGEKVVQAAFKKIYLKRLLFLADRDSDIIHLEVTSCYYRLYYYHKQ